MSDWKIMINLNWSAHFCVCLCMCLSVYLSLSMCLCMCMCLPVCMSVRRCWQWLDGEQNPWWFQRLFQRRHDAAFLAITWLWCTGSFTHDSWRHTGTVTLEMSVCLSVCLSVSSNYLTLIHWILHSWVMMIYR